MIAAIHKEKDLAIAYDSDCMATPEARFFDAGYWRDRKAVTGIAKGRGNTWFIDAPFGAVVLRQYIRGGWAARFSREHYFFTTITRSRPFQEFQILETLMELKLPVPKPVAAMCRHNGILSSGALITAEIAGAQTLADILPAEGVEDTVTDALWLDIGKCISRFHTAGVWHADLNARNILLDSERQVYLIDFDRARFTPQKPVDGAGNLKRLKRSLLKLWPSSATQDLQFAWQRLTSGYYD
jgi:3-deoxy-D-manno-octulosonic acid kinase